MNFKKRVNGSWTDIPHYIHNTSTDIITTLPADLYADGNNATVGLVGNMSQTGTPTPQNPIQPSETGERTGNLWNEEGFSARAITSPHEHTDTNTYGTTLSTTIGKETIITQSEYPTGTVGYQNGFFFIDVDFSKYEIGDKVTLSFDYICNEVHSIEEQVSTTVYAGKNSNSIPVVLSSGKWSVSGRLTAVITVIADMNPYVEVRLCGNSITVKNIMLNTGSTALPFEPYGYKIPILNNSQTTNVYLGEVQSTRRITKYEFTGSETWNTGTENYYSLVPQTYGEGVPYSAIICSHCINATINNTGKAIFFKKTDFPDITTGEELKQYCANQYTNGTPVTVWYMLTEPTTGIVNEPIRKISIYADEVSGITIPAIAGANTLSIGTTLQPSEVTVNYKGWHPVQSVHEKSKNLFDMSTVENGKGIATDGSITDYARRCSTVTPIDVSTYSNVTLAFTATLSRTRVIYALFNDSTLIIRQTAVYSGTTIDVSSGNKLYVCFYDAADTETIQKSDLSNVMLNTGSTPLPYEPYWT